MKKLINDPKTVVREMLQGFVALTPGQALLADENVVIRADILPFAEREVAVISGGGSGHEPAHAGYVGHGMLHAAVVGDVFASPSTDAILSAIRAVSGPKGALLIIKNYTGDRLNFGLAAEVARAEGMPVEMVICADDVSLRAKEKTAGRRGIAGTVLVHKVAGAMAASGASLAEIKRIAMEAAAAVGTMGVALTACIVPAVGRPSFDLPDNEMELGLGIHGEAGVSKVAMQSAEWITHHLLQEIIADKNILAGDHVALLINNLGGTPLMELGIIAHHAVQYLNNQGIVIDRAWAGTFLTAIEMAGCSLSLMKLNETRTIHLDAATEAPAWPNFQIKSAVSGRFLNVVPNQKPVSKPDFKAMPESLLPIRNAVLAVAEALEKAEPELTELDRKVGDGDLGQSLLRAANSARQVFKLGGIQHVADVFSKLGEAVRKEIGGTSGPLYAIFLLCAARALTNVTGKPTGQEWSAALSAGCDAISQLGGARMGDRTMLDALIPASQTFSEQLAKGLSLKEAWALAVQAAEAGAKHTATLTPRLGRSSYLGDRALGVPDPGAVAVALWMKALAQK